MENERIMLKQLLANIERNRVKWRKDIFDSESLSIQRKLALQAVKEKLDKQATLLEEEQAELKDKCDKLRYQEESLKPFHEKLDKISRIGETSAEKKEILLREIRVDFDKYLRMHVAGAKPKKGRKGLRLS